MPSANKPIIYDYKIVAQIILDHAKREPYKFFLCDRRAIPYLFKVRSETPIIIGKDGDGKEKTVGKGGYIVVQPLLKDGKVDFHPTNPELHALTGIWRGHSYNVNRIKDVEQIANAENAVFTSIDYIEQARASLHYMNLPECLGPQALACAGWCASKSQIAAVRFDHSLAEHKIREPWGGGMDITINPENDILHTVVGKDEVGDPILDAYPNRKDPDMNLWRPIDGRFVENTNALISMLPCVTAQMLERAVMDPH